MVETLAEPSARPLDRVVGGYLLLSAVALAFPSRPDIWPILLVGHLGLGLALATGRIQDVRAGGGVREVVADWLPLLLLPFLYWELPVLSTAIWGGHYFDLTVQAWEVAVFGGQPAVSLARRFDSLWVSEPLHLAYLSYYPILYFYPLVVYLKKGRPAFHDTLFAMMLGFAIHYAVFITFPVKGPYFLFPPPGEPMSSGLFYTGVQAVLGGGASAGTAFPSSHVALATVQTSNAWRHMRVAAPIMAVCVLGILAGAVYAGIHYAIDVVVGLFTGAAVGLSVPTVRRWLS